MANPILFSLGIHQSVEEKVIHLNLLSSYNETDQDGENHFFFFDRYSLLDLDTNKQKLQQWYNVYLQLRISSQNEMNNLI